MDRRPQFGDLASFGTVEAEISVHRNIVFSFGHKRILYPLAKSHFSSKFIDID